MDNRPIKFRLLEVQDHAVERRIADIVAGRDVILERAEQLGTAQP
jgi:hypothetical protein